LIYRSGRVKLEVGAHLYDVNHGSDCNFAQDVGCVIASNMELIFLGKCTKRLVVTPDIVNMVQHKL